MMIWGSLKVGEFRQNNGYSLWCSNVAMEHLPLYSFHFKTSICSGFPSRPRLITRESSHWSSFSLLNRSFFGYTLWLFNIAMENGPFIDDCPIKTSIYEGFSMAMLNNQMVIPLFQKNKFWTVRKNNYHRSDHRSSINTDILSWKKLDTGWWFGTFFIFLNIWDNPSHWLIFFRG